MGTVVVKIGTSSITDELGVIDTDAVAKLCEEVAELHRRGERVVVVSSGAVSAGVAAFGLGARPADMPTLQALAAAGQSRLMRTYDDLFAAHGLVAAQVLLSPHDFVNRRQYLHARQTLHRLLELGAVPIVNENDAIADDEIRFGDNDRLAALVAHLVHAHLLVLLTDTPGLLTADPRLDEKASLIEEVVSIDRAIEAVVGGAGTARGSGGMASKIAAAKIASWSGVATVIASARRAGVLADALARTPGVGTFVHARDRKLPARKLWIAFAVAASGTLVVDEGARWALIRHGRSLLPAGITEVSGSFDVEDAVEVAGPDGLVFAKGLVRMDDRALRAAAGRRSVELGDRFADEAIHRDDLVILPG